MHSIQGSTAAGPKAATEREFCAEDGAAEPSRPLAVTLPDGARAGQSLTVQTPWGETVQVVVPEGGFSGGVAHFLV